jgi:triphosphoribosyl-dephospho-CoA synthase
VKPLDPQSIATTVSNCASLAALLEVSAYPKPGNIHRLRDFPETSYEHFLAGGVALGSVMGELAIRGSVAQDFAEVRVGQGIKYAVDVMFGWQRGGNIHLGIILLFSPLSAAAGAVLSDCRAEIQELREYTSRIIANATPLDSIDIYSAIGKAMSSENLGSADELDVTNRESSERILEENITPLEIFRRCKDRDLICREWVTGFKTVFETGCPYLREKITGGSKINDATVDTFIKLLSENPDSLITRKTGTESAKQVSEKAKQIIEAGGAESEEGKKMLWSLDEELRKEEGRLNPGTTADLTATSLYVLLLSGWRP